MWGCFNYFPADSCGSAHLTWCKCQRLLCGLVMTWLTTTFLYHNILTIQDLSSRTRSILGHIIGSVLALLFYHSIWLRSSWAWFVELTTIWTEAEVDNIGYLRLVLYFPNSVTCWCLLWCTEVQLDWLKFSTTLYSPEEQFRLSVADTACAILRQLCLAARHTPSSPGYEESSESLLSPPEPTKCRESNMSGLDQAQEAHSCY